MKYNLFGREIVFEISEKKKKTEISNKNIFLYRFLLAVSIFFIFGIFMEISNLSKNYEIGAKAPKDIIAYKNVIYYVDLLDKNLENKVKKNTTPEYVRSEKVETEAINLIESFINDGKKIDLNNNESIETFLTDRKSSLSVDEFKEIISKSDVSYVLDIIEQVREIYKIGIVKNTDFKKIVEQKHLIMTEINQKFISDFIKPNLFLDELRTQRKIEDNIKSLRNREVKIYKGDIIVKKDQIIDSDAYEKMEKLNLVRSGDKVRKGIGMFLTFGLLMNVFYYLVKKYSKKTVESQAFYPSLMTIIIINLIHVLFLKDELLLYLLPFATIPIILTILGDKLFALLFTIMNMIILTRDDNWFLVVMAVVLVAIYKADKLTNRSEIVKLGIFLGMFQATLAFSYGLVNQLELSALLMMIVFSVMSGIFTGMTSLALLPYYENTFDILTDIKLVELSDFSHPLLKQLLMTAPGTFHHSIMVGALAESGAEAIGANATFTRVSSYYHDIGKMKRPEFFVENQKGGENPHDKIKSSLSALIITSHTKDGYIMGKQHKLPKEVLNIILEHHGTTLVGYFYSKALEKGEKVSEQDFRYSGPKPKTKESGIILMADTVEAAVRSSENKSREGIESLIRYLIKTKIEDGQLDNSDLTLGEIEKIIQAFLNTLQGVYHERIKYPKLDEARKK